MIIDQVKLTTLLAQATAEVVKYFEGLTDFDAEKVSGLQFVEEVMTTSPFGSRDAVEEAKRKFVENFPAFKKAVRALMVSQAEGEIAKAINEANDECLAHAERLAVLRKIHAGMLKAIDEEVSELDEAVDDDLKNFARTSNADLRQRVEQGHQALMDIVREKHLLELEYCFRSHLVSEATAKELAFLHEVTE